jgi:hypothetical protein
VTQHSTSEWSNLTTTSLLLLPYCCRATARACQLTRGLLPMLATPGPNGDAVLEAAVIKAAMAGLVAPKHHVVVLQQIHNDLCVKVCCLWISCTSTCCIWCGIG